MFFDSWVLDWFAILNIATLALTLPALIFDKAGPQG